MTPQDKMQMEACAHADEAWRFVERLKSLAITNPKEVHNELPMLREVSDSLNELMAKLEDRGEA